MKGDGDPVILIHGYGAGIWVWEKQIDFLSSFYRVYALDLIGHGFSDRPKIAYTPETYIHFFRDFMTAIGIEKATLIGNSMGGGLAWSVAALFPERVKRLVLIDCIPPDVLESGQRMTNFRAMIFAERFPFLLYRDDLQVEIEIRSDRSSRNVSRIRRLITPDVVERQYEISRIEGTTWTLYSTFRNAERGIETEGLPFTDQPAHLLIWGEKDLFFLASVGQETSP